MERYDFIIPGSVFVAVGVFTPGPNNVMITASGVNFGFRRTIPHMCGIAIGSSVMNLAVGLGLGRIFILYPDIHVALKYISAAYLLFLAWKIATSAGGFNSGPGKNASRPFSFFQAAAFQWVNPKAWSIAVGAVAAFTTVGGNLLAEVVAISLILIVITIPGVSAWTYFGTVIGRFLHTPGRLKAFNAFMAGLLVLSLVPVLA